MAIVFTIILIAFIIYPLIVFCYVFNQVKKAQFLFFMYISCFLTLALFVTLASLTKSIDLVKEYNLNFYLGIFLIPWGLFIASKKSIKLSLTENKYPYTRNRFFRIIIGLFIPILVINILVFLKTLIFNATALAYIWTYPLIAGLIFMACILPSLIYSLLMEFLINPAVKSAKLAVTISCTIGGLLALTVMYFDSKPESPLYIIYGITTGFIVGLILRKNYNKAS